MHQAFVSYSSKDEGLVRQHLQLLRARGITCWFAPECVPGGEDFAKLVERAIAQSTIVLLMATRNAIESRDVLRELVLADDSRVPVVPLVLSPELTFDRGFNYRLAGRQHIHARGPWVDAVVAALEYHRRAAARTRLEASTSPGRREERIASGLIPYLADRDTQEMIIGQVLEEHIASRSHRPLCFIVHGEEAHCCDMFVERLSKHFIPDQLERLRGSNQLEAKLIRWPDHSPNADSGQTRSSLYWRGLFTRLELPYSAHPGDLVRHLTTLRRPALFYSILGIDASQTDETELITRIIAAWSTLPDIPGPSQPLIILMSVSYPAHGVSLLDRLWGVPLQSPIATQLIALKSPKPETIALTVLPELTSLSLNDVLDWARKNLASDEIDDVLFVLRAIFSGRRKDAELRIRQMSGVAGGQQTAEAILEALFREKFRAGRLPMEPLAPLLKHFVRTDRVLRSI